MGDQKIQLQPTETAEPLKSSDTSSFDKPEKLAKDRRSFRATGIV
jgi:hypothetical protein